MSYESQRCPCAGRKERETMLCPQCVAQFGATPDYARMNDSAVDWYARRSAAIRVLACARRRRATNTVLS